MFRKHYFAIFYSILLTAFTVYMALDTFVITRVYAAVPSAEASSIETEAEEESAETNASWSSVSTETAYQDENISVTITEYREYDSSIYVADIRLSSPEYLKTALAQNAYGKNVTDKTSEMALENNAVLAINGDYYGARETGYVLRNGVLYRDTAQKGQEDLVIYEDGSFEIIVEDQVTAQELLDKGAVQILSFGPALVNDSEISVTTDEEVGKAKSSNPRTAIGVIDDLHYVFVVSDGRTDESEGLSLYQLAQFMSSLGVRTAYNLDGGGSSTMVFNGTVINTPTNTGKRSKERSVSDIVYIG
ncbi:MAG: phosphodiester glycosidase family protein [Lachnospiraceae bacterium]|nr:phosphodiester glycosidase family protein [Lachnospiraceae bacterium]